MQEPALGPRWLLSGAAAPPSPCFQTIRYRRTGTNSTACSVRLVPSSRVLTTFFFEVTEVVVATATVAKWYLTMAATYDARGGMW